jgi:hypothetical protein
MSATAFCRAMFEFAASMSWDVERFELGVMTHARNRRNSRVSFGV